jgi:hypothetical protein
MADTNLSSFIWSVAPEVLSTVLDILLKRGLWEALRDLPATAAGSR